MSRRSIIACTICAILSFNAPSAGPARGETLRLYMPIFSGPADLSRNVMTTLYFRIWQGYSGRGQLGSYFIYGDRRLPQESHEAAIRAALWPTVYADLAFWGDCNWYGDGVVVQSYLTLTPRLDRRNERPDLWIVVLPTSDGSVRLERSVPNHYYEFEPFVLKRDSISELSKPHALPLYRTRTGAEEIGKLSTFFDVLEIHDDALKLRSGEQPGWVRPPNLTRQSIEAINFTTGIVNFLRGSWRGAIEDFQKVLGSESTPQSIRIDSHIYLGMALEKLDKSGREEFEMAYGLNTFNEAAAAMLIMEAASTYARTRQSAGQEAAAEALARLKRLVNDNRQLFPAEDSWLQRVDAALAQ